MAAAYVPFGEPWRPRWPYDPYRPYRPYRPDWLPKPYTYPTTLPTTHPSRDPKDKARIEELEILLRLAHDELLPTVDDEPSDAAALCELIEDTISIM